MEKKAGKHNQKDKPNWDWSHIECYLKTVQSNRKSIIWNLAPSIILTNPSTESAGPNVRLYIDTEKSLQYSSELGWNWHKSWNIPNISLRLEIKDESTGDFLLSPRNLYAQIFAVKKNTENQKSDRTTLVDVGIRGENKMQMIDGQVYFSAIKFSSTTYNNQGINFNLLIVLYINQGQFEKPKVLTAVISPPIFVDSRRSARDYQQKKFSSFVQPFGYDNIQKQFIKRENKSKCESEVIIRNDPQGFYNYITAPNIRHKVKHPVFLTIKFSNCVKIYYNSRLVEKTNLRDMLENLQTRLLKENKNKQKNQGDLSVNLDDKYFVFVVSNLTDSLKRKKVIQSIETMQNQYIGISCVPQELIQEFLPIQSIDELKKAYKDTFDSLMNICQNYQPQYLDQSDDQYYSEQYEESQKSSKKVKKDNAAEQNKTNGHKNKTTIISNKALKQQKPSDKPKPETILKKEELFQSQFQPVYFGQTQNQLFGQKKSAPSAFNKAAGSVGFRNVADNPIFDTSNLNKAFSSNLSNYEVADMNNQNNSFMGDQGKNAPFKNNDKLSQNSFLTSNGLGMNQHISVPQPMQQSKPNSINQNNHNINISNGSGFSLPNMGQGMGQSMGQGMGQGFGGNTIYDNLLYSNLMLTNWLTSVKNNNNSLYDSMLHHNLADQIIHKNNVDRYMQADQQQKMLEMNRLPLQSQQQQSIVCLIQQISLYKELLSQVTYQNQLLSRDITLKQHNQQQQQQNSSLKYQQPELNQYGGINSNGMMGMNYMHGGSMGGMQGGLAGLQGISNMSGLLGNTNMINNQGQQLGIMINQNRASESSQRLQGKDFLNTSNSMSSNPLGKFQIGSSGLSIVGNPSSANQGGSNFGASYELIKSMILEEMKKQAELKEQSQNK